MGVKGYVRVEVLTDFPRRFAPKSRLFIKGRPYVVEHSRIHGKLRAVKFEGVDSFAPAKALADVDLEVPVSELAALPEGSYYHYHLVGLQVRTTDGEELGELVEIMVTGSNDVYIVERDGKQVLIPAIPDVVQDVDIEGGVLTITVIPGLLS